jgi:sigma-54 specific flagellar transcriptional regulator A
VQKQDVKRFLDLPSRLMRDVYQLVERVAPLGSTVYIQGPSGSGKEIIARSIHLLSGRNGGPFVPVNCGAIPRELLESELFGYEKGAFTGAAKERQGLMEVANGGTLFLDEIGDMPLDMQVKLLRLLEERTFTRVGGSKPIKVNVRFVCATHRDLTQMIRDEKFREDLFYRINVFPIFLPPLKDRADDIPRLIALIKERFEIQGFPPSPRLTPCGIEALQAFPWPGNIRELRNVLERAGALYPDQQINGQLINNLLRPFGAIDRHVEEEAIWSAVAELSEPISFEDLSPDVSDEIRNAVSSNGEQSSSEIYNVRQILNGSDVFNLKDYIAQLEIEFIKTALKDTDGSVSAAARMLGFQRTTLIEKMKKFSIIRNET